MVTWSDGESAELGLSAVSLGAGCVNTAVDALGQDGPAFTATFPVTLSAHSDDGRFDADHAGQLIIGAGAAGAIESIVGEATRVVEPALLEGLGFSDISLDEDFHRLSLSLRSQLRADSMTGTIVLNGITDPPCLTDPPEPDPGGMGAPGCEGSTVTELESGAWDDSASTE
jgi:hypothetical protein